MNLAPMKVIVRYTKRPAHATTIGSVGTGLLPRKIVFTIICSICTIRHILVDRTLLLLARRHHEEQLDAAIVPFAENFLSSSAAITCLVTNEE
jgi:hypothetical protein